MNEAREVVVRLDQLQLADKVFDKGHESIGILTVKQIEPDKTDPGKVVVTFFRPYTSTADFTYTGGVICYIGVEEFKVYRQDHEFTLIERKQLK